MPAVALVAAFLVVPALELWVLIEVGRRIGGLFTVALLVAVSVLGAALVRREGRAAWSRFRSALASGRVPTGEVVDGALVVLGGALLLTPGFLTDLLGLVLIVPPSRALVNRAVRSRVRSTFLVAGPSRRRTRVSPPIDVEVVDVEREPPRDRPGGHPGH